jgi:hypothetical protein
MAASEDMRATGRPFQFRCLRCGSALEARSNMCGRPGQCPTCNAEFIVPEMDLQTGLAISHANPGDDGENPTPVHAYAAAGAKAPRIVRLEDDTPVIECPRCDRQCPIRSDNCPACGLPFTMEGMSPGVVTRSGGNARLALTLGMIAAPLSLCGGIGIAPGIIAVALGIFSLANQDHSDRFQALLGMVLGGLACIIAAVVWAEML